MPPDDSNSRTRRRLLESLLAIGVGGLGTGVGTAAIYSDTGETNDVLASGTVELTLGRRRVRIDPDGPGDSGVETVSVANAGSLGVVVDWLRLAALECDSTDENEAEDRTCEWETDVDGAEGNRSDRGTAGGSSAGRLGSHLRVRIGFDRHGTGQSSDAVTVVGPVTLAELSLPAVYETAYELAASGEAGDRTQLFVAWELDSGAPAEAALAEIGFAIDLHARQT